MYFFSKYSQDPPGGTTGPSLQAAVRAGSAADGDIAGLSVSKPPLAARSTYFD